MSKGFSTFTFLVYLKLTKILLVVILKTRSCSMLDQKGLLLLGRLEWERHLNATNKIFLDAIKIIVGYLKNNIVQFHQRNGVKSTNITMMT